MIKIYKIMSSENNVSSFISFIDTICFYNLKDLKFRWNNFIKDIKNQLTNEDGTPHHKFTIIEDNYDEKDFKKCNFKFSYIRKLCSNDNTEECEFFDTIITIEMFVRELHLYENEDEFKEWYNIELEKIKVKEDK